MSTVCEECGKEVPDGSRYCNWCGNAIKPVEMRVSSGGRVCHHCGAMNPEVSAFCQNCARDFPPPVRLSATSDEGVLTTKCWSCGARASANNQTCDVCGASICPEWIEVREARSFSNAPLHAAVLFVGAGSLGLIGALRILTVEDYALPDYGIDVGGMLCFCGALELIFACCAFAAALMSYRRGSFTLTLGAGVLGMLGVGPLFLGSLLALIGVILVAMNRDAYD